MTGGSLGKAGLFARIRAVRLTHSSPPCSKMGVSWLSDDTGTFINSSLGSGKLVEFDPCI